MSSVLILYLFVRSTIKQLRLLITIVKTIPSSVHGAPI